MIDTNTNLNTNQPTTPTPEAAGDRAKRCSPKTM